MSKESEYRKQLKATYVKEARLANDRLRSLEKLSKNPDYDKVLDYAYRVAMNDIKKNTTARGAGNRFTIPKNTKQLERALADVRKFNESATYNKTQIDIQYANNASNFNRIFGTNFTWQELKHFTDDVNWNDFKKEYGSEKLVKAIKTLTSKVKHLTDSDKEKVVKEIDADLKKHKRVIADEVQNEVAQQLVEKGLTLDKLMSGTGEFYTDTDNESPFID